MILALPKLSLSSDASEVNLCYQEQLHIQQGLFGQTLFGLTNLQFEGKGIPIAIELDLFITKRNKACNPCPSYLYKHS